MDNGIQLITENTWQKKLQTLKKQIAQYIPLRLSLLFNIALV